MSCRPHPPLPDSRACFLSNRHTDPCICCPLAISLLSAVHAVRNASPEYGTVSLSTFPVAGSSTPSSSHHESGCNTVTAIRPSARTAAGDSEAFSTSRLAHGISCSAPPFSGSRKRRIALPTWRINTNSCPFGCAATIAATPILRASPPSAGIAHNALSAV